MDMNRLNDMLERYGEVCIQKTAGKILNVVPRTISRMMDEGRLSFALGNIHHRHALQLPQDVYGNQSAPDPQEKARAHGSAGTVGDLRQRAIPEAFLVVVDLLFQRFHVR